MNHTEFEHPETLVDTAWVAGNLNIRGVQLVEVDVDTAAYDEGHIPGAVGWNWQIDTQDQLRRDIPTAEDFQALLERSGISNETTIVLYGDNNNWFAAYAFWLLKYYRHDDVRLLDGGRMKWLAEGREMTTEVPQPAAGSYTMSGTANNALRAMRGFVEESIGRPDRGLVDVRSPGEFSGKLLAPPGLPQEGSQRGGHIPGAVNIGWGQAVADDGTFKTRTVLENIYRSQGITPDKEIIAYCRIGERSSHTWFVLEHLLGYPNVRNYDGSWTEWGSSIGVPIEKP